MAHSSNGEALDLDLREGLPDALCGLLVEYPRAGWESHSGYDGLIRFWLDRHMMFLRMLGSCKNRPRIPSTADLT